MDNPLPVVTHRKSSNLRSFATSRGQMQQAFGTPDADDPHPQGISPVHDAKWRMDEFPQEGLIGSGTTDPCLDDWWASTRWNISSTSLAPTSGAPAHVPSLYLLKIAERGFSDADCHPGIVALFLA